MSKSNEAFSESPKPRWRPGKSQERSLGSQPIEAFSQMQMWYHKHIIHIMIFFILSGLPLLSSHFSFLAYLFGVPASWVTGSAGSAEILATGIQVARIMHRVMALMFVLVTIPFLLTMLKDIKRLEIWPHKWGVGATIDGFRELAKTYLTFKHGRIGKYNAGQKLGAWVMISTSLMLLFSGFVLMFRDLFGLDFVAAMRAVHAACFVVFGLVLIVHMYLGTHPINRKSLVAIFRTGEYDEETVKHHHPLWYEKLKKRK